MRRPEHRVPGMAEIAVALVIGHDENDIRALRLLSRGRNRKTGEKGVG